MIVDSIKFAEYYADMHPEFRAVFKALKSLTADSSGRIDIDGEHAFINVSSYTNKPVSECSFESHGRYIDIQYIVAGEEIIDVADSSVLQVTDDRLEKDDIAFYKDPVKYHTGYLEPGKFAVIFPGEAHRPCVAPDGKGVQVTKAVAKILL